MPTGRVIDTEDQPRIHCVWLQIRNETGGNVGLYVERSAPSRSVSPNDIIRWEGPDVWWTPRGPRLTGCFENFHLSLVPNELARSRLP